MDAASAVERYRRERPVFADAAVATETLLKTICRRAGVLGRVEAREKDVISYIKKTRVKAAKYTDFWGEVVDKLGGRMILETTDDRDKALAGLLAATDLFASIGEPDDKSAGIDPDELVYPGVHVQVTLKDPQLSDGEPIECEVQIRTKAEDLWSVPSHKLLYKPLIQPEWATARRIWRLRAVVEIFDEEVSRAMTESASLPGGREAALLRTAESEYYRFVSMAGDDDLSLLVLTDLAPALADLNLPEYGAVLRAFVQEKEDKLAQVYEEYGPGSANAEIDDYYMFTQPESVILFERMTARPRQLAETATGAGFAHTLKPMYEAWGMAFPE